MDIIKRFARQCAPRAIRNWLRTPAKTARYISDRLAYSFGSTPKVTVTDQWTIRCHPAAREHFAVFRNDPSQAEELASFFEYARPGMQLLDVGAHYGFFALAALHAGGTTARVVSVEPSSRAARILEANLVANSAQTQVKIVRSALGGHDGELSMLTTGPAGADYFMVPTEKRNDVISVSQRSMRSVLAEAGMKPTHVKMDIEGFELETIEGAVDVLSALRPILYLELHGVFLRSRGKDPANVISNLRRAGYRSFLIAGRAMDDQALAARNYTCRLVCLT